MSDPLLKLFGSGARLKLLRLFLFNPRASFTVADVGERARVTALEARRELALYESIGLIKRTTRGRGVRYQTSVEFTHLAALQNLLLNAPARSGDIIGRLRGLGTFKLVVLSGIFLNEWDSPVDLLIVGEKLKVKLIQDQLKKLESEIGKELRYTVLTGTDFSYRLNMNDKLLRDTFDYAHKVLIDKLNFSLKR